MSFLKDTIQAMKDRALKKKDFLRGIEQVEFKPAEEGEPSLWDKVEPLEVTKEMLEGNFDLTNPCSEILLTNKPSKAPAPTHPTHPTISYWRGLPLLAKPLPYNIVHFADRGDYVIIDVSVDRYRLIKELCSRYPNHNFFLEAGREVWTLNSLSILDLAQSERPVHGQVPMYRLSIPRDDVIREGTVRSIISVTEASGHPFTFKPLLRETGHPQPPQQKERVIMVASCDDPDTDDVNIEDELQ